MKPGYETFWDVYCGTMHKHEEKRNEVISINT